MYALIRTGGKQYRVTPGELVRIGNLTDEVGAAINFDEVLAVHNGEELTVGSPLVSSATVNATVVAHGRGQKIIVYRFKRRKAYHRKKGHRQDYTEVKIDSINLN